MVLKDWRQSKSDKMWFFKPGKNKFTGYDEAEVTLNAIKFGTDYDIYLGQERIKRVSSKEQALRYMRSFMRTH